MMMNNLLAAWIKPGSHIAATIGLATLTGLMFQGPYPRQPSAWAREQAIRPGWVIGAVVPVVNLPDTGSNRLRLTDQLLAQIFQGLIVKWNDPRLQEMNPDVRLPDLAIAPVYRADGAVITRVVTTYLSTADFAWREAVGIGYSVAWPVGTGARGSGGVARLIGTTLGSIGFVEYAVAQRSGLTLVRLRNSAGAFVTADRNSILAAAENIEQADGIRRPIDLIDDHGTRCWPMTSLQPASEAQDWQNQAGLNDRLRLLDWEQNNGSPALPRLE